MQQIANTAQRAGIAGVTQHAALRMQQRGIAAGALSTVLTYGRRVHAKGVIYFVVGRKEVARYAIQGIDLKPVEGIHALVTTDGAVVTVYRNQDLRRIHAPMGRGSKKQLPKLH